MDNETFETYEAPEMYELGHAAEPTLGNGEGADDHRGGRVGAGFVRVVGLVVGLDAPAAVGDHPIFL